MGKEGRPESGQRRCGIRSHRSLGLAGGERSLAGFQEFSGTRRYLREVAEGLGPRELETLVAFAEFLKARRAARGFAHHHEHQMQERAEAMAASQRGISLVQAGDKGAT